MRVSNLLRRAAVAVVSVALIACADPAEPEPDPEAAAEVGPAESIGRTLPAPSEETPRYVGSWAASAEMCRQPAWLFSARELSTLGEVSCTFDDVALTNTGYAIQATCTAQAPPERSLIQLSFAESARAMMISGGPWGAPIGLVYCGPLSNP
ncbi:MAG: hypothetical protein AB7O98_00880 [Hyphomonadaceae bacterium]